MLTVEQIGKCIRGNPASALRGVHSGPHDRVFDEYPFRPASPVLQTAEQKKELSKSGLRLKFRGLMAKGDEKIIWENCYQRATNPVEPAKSRDPLYRKLQRVINIARTKLNGLDGAIQQYVMNKLMLPMERRTMREGEYMRLNKQSARQIYEGIRDAIKSNV